VHGQPPVSPCNTCSPVVGRALASWQHLCDVGRLSSVQSATRIWWNITNQRRQCNSASCKDRRGHTLHGLTSTNRVANVGVKLGMYNGTTCLETFLADVKNFVAYFHCTEEDELFHLCSFLRGLAGQLRWNLLQVPTLRWQNSSICRISTLGPLNKPSDSGWNCTPASRAKSYSNSSMKSVVLCRCLPGAINKRNECCQMQRLPRGARRSWSLCVHFGQSSGQHGKGTSHCAEPRVTGQVKGC